MIKKMLKGNIKQNLDIYLAKMAKKYPKQLVVTSPRQKRGGLVDTCGDYEIIMDIDSGSYGQVKLAKDLDGQQVAIKLIDAEKVVKQKKERHV